MKKCNDRVIKVVLSAVATAFHWAFGGWSMALIALIALIVVDFFTGLAVAKKNGEIDSNKGRQGAFVKSLYFALIFTMRMMDKGLGLPFPALQTLATWNLILVEGESIVENLGALGVPIHKSLRQAFKRLRDREHDIPLPGLSGLGAEDHESMG